MKRRYDADEPSRLSADAALGRALAGRTRILQIHFSGPFWQLREWVGFAPATDIDTGVSRFVHWYRGYYGV